MEHREHNEAASPPSTAQAPPAAENAPEAAASANAGMTITHWLAGQTLDQQVAHSRSDVVVATVEQVDQENATNARPPRVTLRIREVLRGDPEADRRRGLWAPFPHDVDYGVIETNPIYQAWARQPLAGPTPGTELILLGEMQQEEERSIFWISPVGRFPFSKENRDLALEGVATGERLRRERAEQAQAEKQAYQQKMQAWRAKYSAADLAKFTQAADFVGVGEVTSGPGIHGNLDVHDYEFHVTEILKGDKRKDFQGDTYYLRVWVPKDISELLYPRDRRFLLFLSEKDLDLRGAVPTYTFIEPGDGLVEADPAALQAVQAALPPQATNP